MRTSAFIKLSICVQQLTADIKIDNLQVAVLLIDCQGTGDVTHSSPHLDTVIFYISLQLANVQIMNLMKQMTTSDIERIEVRKAWPI